MSIWGENVLVLEVSQYLQDISDAQVLLYLPLPCPIQTLTCNFIPYKIN